MGVCVMNILYHALDNALILNYYVDKLSTPPIFRLYGSNPNLEINTCGD